MPRFRKSSWFLRHQHWMAEAIRFAEKGRPTTSPNPMVGACIVKGNRLVGTGYHQRYGGDHAEVIALKRAGKRAKGATLYVTLEPCSTWGKTPPCVAAILRAGIRRVVIGALDPNPKNRGKGVSALKKEGISVIQGILAREVEVQNESFFKYVRRRMPFVTLKMAQSLDGKIATREGRSRWISSDAARKFVHRLRTEQDAILIGRNTLLRDNPLLSPRMKIRNADETRPWRIVVDPEFEVSERARVFQGKQLTLVAVSERILKRKRLKKKKGSAFVLLPVRESDGHLCLKDLLKRLASLGIAKLLCEGGGELAWSLLKGGFVDKIHWIVAPKFIGGRSAKTSVEGKGVGFPSEAIRCDIMKMERLGEDWHIEGSVKQ